MCDSRTARLQPFFESQKLQKLQKNQGTEFPVKSLDIGQVTCLGFTWSKAGQLLILKIRPPFDQRVSQIFNSWLRFDHRYHSRVGCVSPPSRSVSYGSTQILMENIPILLEAFLLLQAKVDGHSFSGNVCIWSLYVLTFLGLNENKKKKKNMVKP